MELLCFLAKGENHHCPLSHQLRLSYGSTNCRVAQVSVTRYTPFAAYLALSLQPPAKKNIFIQPETKWPMIKAGDITLLPLFASNCFSPFDESSFFNRD